MLKETVSITLAIVLTIFATVASAGDAKVTYFHNDLLGSPVAGSDETGNVIWHEEYAPYGEKLEEPAENFNDIGYTGHQSDDDLGLTYMQARYYDPVVGRFYSNDPVGFRDTHSFNRYTYAYNNPYKYTDPKGLDVVFAVDPKAAGGNGHTTLYFQDGEGNWYSYNQGASGETASGGNLGFLMGQDAPAGVSIQEAAKESIPSDGLNISTSSDQDTKITKNAKASMEAHNSGKIEYNLYSNNCTDAAVDVVNNSGAGITVSNPATTIKPNSWIKEVKNNEKSVKVEEK